MAGARDAFLWDDDLKGFGVKSTPAGAKIYLIQYRMGGRGAPTLRWTIGRHGAWTAASAREEAERLLRDVAVGLDPRIEHLKRGISQSAPSPDIDALPFEAYAARFLELYAVRQWRPRTYATRESDLRRWIIPTLKGKQITAITKRDIVEVLDRLPAASPALPRNVFALLRKIFAWAVERGDLDKNPVDGMKSPSAVASRERVLSTGELRGVLQAAESLKNPFDSFILFLAVSGQRLNEVAAMDWSEIHQATRSWAIPGSRTKNGQRHEVPLSNVLVAELKKLSREATWPRTGLVFTTTGTTSISGFSGIKRRLDAAVHTGLGVSIAPWRLHDLRRTFATRLQSLGIRFEVIEALLNHISGSKSGVAGVYQRHDWAEEKIAAMNAWDAHVQKTVLTADGGNKPVHVAVHPLIE